MVLSYLEKDLRACRLCEHQCGADRLSGERGVCRAAGPIVASRTLHPAPPESYTIFMAGCNFKCLNCQNWSISQYPDNAMSVDGYVRPELLARESVGELDSYAGQRMGADRIFFSGGEPTIHLPYIERLVGLAGKLKPDVRVNFDTNGFMTEASLQRILNFATSLTFDIKAYEDDTHRAITGAAVAPVLRNAEIVAGRAADKLWEFRVVVIPGINEAEIESICRFVAGLGRDLPVCFLAFRPNFVLDEHPGASKSLMDKCLTLAREAGLKKASIAGLTDIPGRIGPIRESAGSAYAGEGAAMAGSQALSRGCKTHPRDCLECLSLHECPLKRYIPSRSC